MSCFEEKWEEDSLILYREPKLAKVTFVNISGYPYLSLHVYLGHTVSVPENIKLQEFYVFTGWFVDEERTSPFDFKTPIFSDTTLYAGFTKVTNYIFPLSSANILNSYPRVGRAGPRDFVNIIFYYGSPIFQKGALTVRRWQRVSPPELSLEEFGVKVIGWSSSEYSNNFFDFNQLVYQDCILYAQFVSLGEAN